MNRGESGPSITSVDDARLVRMINAAEKRVLLLSPGVSVTVADAICTAWRRLGPDAVNVILDIDPEVCRLGYGTMEGLNILRQAAAKVPTLVCHQPGVRIGLLISDDTTLVFSPTPLLIEAGTSQPYRPNAIQLQTLPEEVATDLGLGADGDRERVVGLDPVRPGQIEAVQQDLDNVPPVKFDLARRVRVFTSRFQFVELAVAGCFISRKKVPIPSSLVGLARHRDVESQFHAHFNLVNNASVEIRTRNGRVVNEAFVKRLRQEIEKRFLIQLEGYGKVVLRGNKEKLLCAVRGLRAAVKIFQRGIRQELQKHMDANAEALIDGLFPAVKMNPPDAYIKFHGPSVPDAFLRKRLEEDILKAFGRAEGLLQEMKVSLVFKDVTYESLVDDRFLEVARKAMPGVNLLHEEYEATRAMPQEEMLFPQVKGE